MTCSCGEALAKRPYLTFHDVGEYLGERPDTIQELVAFGQLVTVTLPNGQNLVPLATLWPRKQVCEHDG